MDHVLGSLAYSIGGIAGHLLDPIGFILAFLCSFFIRRKHHIFIVGLIVAVIVESLLTYISYTRAWGEGLHLGFIASSAQAAASYAIICRIHSKREPSQGTDATGAR